VVVAVLDPRLVTKRYGEFLRATLPPFWQTTDPAVVRGALERLSGGHRSDRAATAPGHGRALVTRYMKRAQSIWRATAPRPAKPELAQLSAQVNRGG